MRVPALLLLLVLLFLLLTGGCATVGQWTNMPDAPQIYGGTRIHLEHPPGHLWHWMLDDKEPREWGNLAVFFGGIITAPWWPVDFCASLALDTAALPVTLVVELIVNPQRSETERAAGNPTEAETIPAPTLSSAASASSSS